MNGWIGKLDHFDTLSLAEMETISLLNRQDTKFGFSIGRLEELLDRIQPDYLVLETGDGRQVLYRNRYFDTPDFKMFRDHHNGKRNRYKFRFRCYGDSGPCFFEIKFKNNKSRTIKKRLPVTGMRQDLGLQEVAALLSETLYSPQDLLPALDVAFTRFTLVNRKLNDRCTLDTGITISRGGKKISFPGLVICEIKQERSSRNNEMTRAFENMHITPLSLSKYCLGILYLVEGVRYNRFKEKTLRLRHLTSTDYA